MWEIAIKTPLRIDAPASNHFCYDRFQTVDCKNEVPSKSAKIILLKFCFSLLYSVVFPKRKLQFPVHQISWVSAVIEYVIFLHRLAQQWRPRKKLNLARGWCPKFEYTHSAEKVRDTTLNDENASQHMKSVLLMALCNQPEAFASDLGDDQSRYL